MLDISQEILSELTVHMKYSRYEPTLKRRETWPELVGRNQAMHAAKFPTLRREINEAYQYVRDRKILPSMRSMQFAGRPIELSPSRIYNCFSRDTRFITSTGVKSFEDFNAGDVVGVLSPDGSWQPATVRSYGRQKLYRLTFKRGRSEKVVLATRNHRWLLSDGRETTNIQVGDKLLPVRDTFSDFIYESSTPLERLYWAYGYVFGDGTCVRDGAGKARWSMVRLCGKDKQRFLSRFEELGFTTSSSTSLNGDVIAYTGAYLKEVPNFGDGMELLRAFVAGYMDADGTKQTDPTMSNRWKGIQSSDEDHISFIDSAFEAVGLFITRKESLTGQPTNYGVRGETYRYGLYHNTGTRPNTFWVLSSVEEAHEDEVWCLEVSNTQAFVLSGGLSTGNCAYLPVDDWRAFSEIMFLLLGGTGVGYSVQHRHVEKLPAIQRPNPERTRRYLVGDSIEGWADAVRMLMKSYFYGGSTVRFDFRDIRPKGARLVTSGGKAPGPQPLKDCLDRITSILESKQDGDHLRDIEVHDIVCHIADAVLAGGIRRAALISLFTHTSGEMILAKSNFPITHWEHAHEDGPVDENGETQRIIQIHTDQEGKKYYDLHLVYEDPAYGQKATTVYWVSEDDFTYHLKGRGVLPWYYFQPHRGRANNSAILLRGAVSKAEFDALWQLIQASGAGEPGIYWTNDLDWGTNPCCEIALRPYQFCNLVEVNASDVFDQLDLNGRVRAAAFLGTLQASYTEFHYLRPIWQRTTEKEALLGVSMTGLGSGAVLHLDLEEAAEVVRQENLRVAAIIGINPAARLTTVKPAGTTSLVLGCSSGIHAWYWYYFLRSIRVNKNEAIYGYLLKVVPEILEDEHFNPTGTAVIRVPQKAPEGAIMRTEPALALLERIKHVYNTWVKPGHTSGANTHNISATVNIKDDEWGEVGAWMWDNKDHYNGLSVLPFDNGTYIQPPFENCTKEDYDRIIPLLRGLDLSQVIEEEDETNLTGELACAGGACAIL
jgi:hypothetical protein